MATNIVLHNNRELIKHLINYHLVKAVYVTTANLNCRYNTCCSDIHGFM